MAVEHSSIRRTFDVGDLMAQLRYTAGVELGGRPDLLAKLGIHEGSKQEEESSGTAIPGTPPEAPPKHRARASDGPRSIARFIAMSEPFVANVLADDEIVSAIGEGSFSRAEVASLAERLEALRRANVEQEKAVGATHSASRALQAAIGRLTTWYRPRRRRVMRALKARVDLKTRLGLAA